MRLEKNKALANAIQKLIDENGYAEIYVYCSKDGYNHLHKLYDHSTDKTLGYSTQYYEAENVKGQDAEPATLNSKVVFKFRCYKVEHIEYETCSRDISGWWKDDGEIFKYKNACLVYEEMLDYIGSGDGYAIHISDLEIFDRPKEISEFYKEIGEYHCYRSGCPYFATPLCRYASKCEFKTKLTQAPQNMVYIESEE